MFNKLMILFSFLFISLLLSQTVYADLRVAATIKPIHSLISGIMNDIGKPTLIIGGGASPHNYSLKPSQARILEKADLVFFVSYDLETNLKKSISVIASESSRIELAKTENLMTLPFRTGGIFNSQIPTAKSEKKINQNADASNDVSRLNIHQKQNHHESEHTHKHDEHEFDLHFWLDPENAKYLVQEIKKILIKMDPVNEARYEANTKLLIKRLDYLIAEVLEILRPTRKENFIVFHDAYQYFERRFGISVLGSISDPSGHHIGAARLEHTQSIIKSRNIACIFAEPQFSQKYISLVTEGTNAKIGVLDPIGANLEPGSDLYFKLIRNMAISIRDCLP